MIIEAESVNSDVKLVVKDLDDSWFNGVIPNIEVSIKIKNFTINKELEIV